MKKIPILLLSIIFSVSFVLIGIGCKEEAVEEEVEEAVEEKVEEAVEEEEVSTEEVKTIVFRNWRNHDVNAMEKVTEAFHEDNPGIIVEFKPMRTEEYYQATIGNLESGTGVPDIMSVHPFTQGLELFKAGHFVELNDLMPEIEEDMPESLITQYSSEGIIYAYPWVSVSHGFFYNKDIFDKYGLTEPKTWAELIDIFETLKANGETGIAGGTLDSWMPHVVGYENYGPNFYGGEPSRVKLVNGEMKVTDEPFVKAFEAVNSLFSYYPDGFLSIDQVTAQTLFTTGRGAIYPGGSWELTPFSDLGWDFEMHYFAPPPLNEGDTQWLCFGGDQGLVIYKDSPNIDAAITFLKWLNTPKAAQIVANNMVGFFPNISGYSVENPVANEFVKAMEYCSVTIRLDIEKLSDGNPGAGSLFPEAILEMAMGNFTPMEAAQFVQDGLETWYEFK